MTFVNEIPVPPIDMVMPELGQALFTYGQIPPLCVCIYMAFKYWQAKKSPLLFYILIAGGLATLLEPIVDVLGLVWFPGEGSWGVFRSFNRVIPVYLFLAYAWYIGGQAMYAYKRMEQGITTRELWQLYGIYAFLNFVIELPGLYLGAYTYYGQKPFEVFGMPAWWAVCNPLTAITLAAIIYKFKPILVGWKLPVIMVLGPVTDGLVNGALNWPVALALNSGSSMWVPQVASVITLCLGLMWNWGLTLITAIDSPTNATKSATT